MKKLKKETIVHDLFALIAQRCMETNSADLSHVNIPLSLLANLLYQKYGLKYTSEHHLYNQLKSYEKEVSLSLFSKTTKESGIYIKVLNLHQFKQLMILNRGLKIMLANGTLDLLKTLYDNSRYPWNLYLGTGSECYYLAKLLLENTEMPINIFTHNIGVIQLFCEHESHLNNIKVFTRFGQINKETYSIASIADSKEEMQDLFLETNFDAIIQSPRYIKDNTTYVVFPIEQRLQDIIVHNTKGIKILLLTLFEFLLPEETIHPYGKVSEYDYIITPTEKTNSYIHEEYINKLPIYPYIKYFSYNIYTTIEKPKT